MRLEYDLQNWDAQICIYYHVKHTHSLVILTSLQNVSAVFAVFNQGGTS